MIAMQYKIVLPSDYPMESIENRIEEKGHLLNGYPGLVYKAYLYSRKDATHYHNSVNSYAPFYIWKDHNAMLTFINSEGFRALCEQFGRPIIQTWFVEGEAVKPSPQHLLAHIHNKSEQGADIHALNYQSWQSINVNWYENISEINQTDGDIYALGYVTQV